MLAEGAAAPERAVEIDVDDVEPMFVGYLLGRCLAPRNAGIVDEDIDPAEARCQLIGDLGNARRVCYIHDGDLGIQALRFQARAPGGGKLGVAIRDDDLRSRLRQGFRAGQSDSLTAAGYDGCLLVQSEFFEIHLFVGPVFLSRPSAPSAHVLITAPSLSKRCSRVGSGDSQTRSPAFRLNSPMQRAVSRPSLPAST